MGEGEVGLCIPGVCFVCLYMCLFFGFILCVCVNLKKKKKNLKKKVWQWILPADSISIVSQRSSYNRMELPWVLPS